MYWFNKIRNWNVRRGKPIILGNVSRTEPISRRFGIDRGTPIDRYYIEKFLQTHSSDISGDVVEIAENTYTRRFGYQVASSTILTYDKDQTVGLYGDLTDPVTLPTNCFDCMILTQTLNFIARPPQALQGISQLLKKDGTLVGTVAGISQVSRFDADRWGDYWRFTQQGLNSLLSDVFSSVHTEVFGNLAAVKYFLDGVCVEELGKTDILNIVDTDYPITIGFTAQK